MTTAPIDQLDRRAALVVVDVQRAFDDPRWGTRNNPGADRNIAALIQAFTAAGRPLVYVRHDGRDPAGTLHPSQPGNRLKAYVEEHEPDLLVTKHVNSAFHGAPDLNSWLTGQGITDVCIAGITTNHCCETTARVGGNLGYNVYFAIDATHTFDRLGPDGTLMTGDELMRATATNLHGEFATVVTTEELLHRVRTGASGR
ncbi:cysteine hydrolase family protein [Nocardioides sp. SYSU D00065]|uniref:cysteine hydrolase family protein n=1 Tax=Nocardioides sp. SYSU D00065 TaxID=2817378 RepID=UPI001FEF4695|nr:cysteine hydrolase family protein [Nocardioides sp. SYSU D00065]